MDLADVDVTCVVKKGHMAKTCPDESQDPERMYLVQLLRGVGSSNQHVSVKCFSSL